MRTRIAMAIVALTTAGLANAQTAPVTQPGAAPAATPAPAPAHAPNTAPTPAYAQADGQWRGSLGAAYSQASGNTKNTSFALIGDAVRATTQDKTTLYGFSQYGKSEVPTSQTTANLWRLGGKYDYNLNQNVFAFGGLDFEHDKLKLLSLRSAVGGGLGYHLVRNATTTWDVYGGLGYKWDSYANPGLLINNTLQTKYNGAELVLGEESTHKLSDTVTFRQRVVMFPNLKDSGEFRAVADAGVVVAMSNRINLQVTLADRYDSMAAGGIKKNDLLLFTGVGIALGNR